MLAAAAIVGLTAQKDPARHLKVSGGRSTLSVFPTILKADQMRFASKATAEGDMSTGEASVGFKISNSDLKFSLIDGKLDRFEGGKISHGGGFTLTLGKKTIDADQFMVVPSRTVANGLDLWVDSDKESYVAFELVNMRPMYFPKTRQMVLGTMDVELSLQGAQHLGRPELTGKLVGTMNLIADADPIDGRGEVVIPAEEQNRTSGGGGEDSVLDVSISRVESLTYMGRAGAAFPNGRNGFSMSTTSCNVGTQNIPWFAPMQTQHPVIAMQMYRLQNGRFEMIGWSWLKHGFFATNSPGCGTCQSPGTGTLLGVGCSDTYGTGNNSDRFYLGERGEVNPLTGVWNCTGSYFSNYIADCTRRNNGSGLDDVAHRLEVSDADLNQSGAQFFYEAYYISASDTNLYNNVANRQATITWNGSSWVPSTLGTFTQGLAMDRWGEERSFAQPQDEGDVKVAVQTTDLGNGMWHYEYAVYNHNLDRQVRTFSIPVPAGANVTNIGFHDIDQNAGNQWSSAIANGMLTWSTGTTSDPNANPLKYASLFNFRFDCNVAPSSSRAIMGMFKTGNGNTKVALIKGPLAFQHLDSIVPDHSRIYSGDAETAGESDDSKLLAGPLDLTRAGVGINGTIKTTASPITSIQVKVESNCSLGAAASQSIGLWNWTTSAWEEIDVRPQSTTDSVTQVTVSTNPGRFVDGNGNCKIRVVQIPPLGNTRWTSYYDQIGLKFN